MNPPFKLEMLPLAELKVHPSLQRDLVEPHANRIALKFDERKFGALTVWYDGKVHWIVNGQHRAWAARKKYGDNGQRVPCHVYPPSCTLDEMAVVVRGEQVEGRAWDAYAKFVLLQVSKDPIALGILEVLSKLKLHISAKHASLSSVQAVGALQSVYARTDGRAALDHALRTLMEIWPNDGDRFIGHLILGIAWVHARHHRKLDHNAFVRAVASRMSALGVIGKARQYRRDLDWGMTRAVGEAFVQLYNRGRAKGRLPSPFDKS